MLTVNAPAKLNLTLEVLGKRPDGYHEIRSVLQTIDLVDALTFRSGDGIVFTCDMPGWSAEKSLVSQAASLMQQAAGRSPGARVEVKKRIPLLSGLGGDSSAAAATLRGLNELWGLGLPMERLLEMAAPLGSDVPFFLYGGTALASGRGEIIETLPPPPPAWAVLVVPDVPREAGKTGRMYAALKESHFTGGEFTEKLAGALREGNGFAPSMLFNTFENVAFSDFNLRRVYVEHLLKLGAPHVHLAGSGPTLFTLLEDKTAAADFYKRCKDQGMEAYLAGTASA